MSKIYLSESERKLLSCIWLFATPWTVAHQAPLFMEFSRQGYWSGLPFPSLVDLPDPGSPKLQADSLSSEPTGKLHTLLSVDFDLMCMYITTEY